jgi:hypothetical protein
MSLLAQADFTEHKYGTLSSSCISIKMTFTSDKCAQFCVVTEQKVRYKIGQNEINTTQNPPLQNYKSRET